ncbi:MAG TPA: isoprenylcysteine carboxylmethyltransferase family protein [Mucilaginibacter sp.]|nr:isoprenylcysteine carboxylmethyltransferase family protein [Mucilaginibacter sp.]
MDFILFIILVITLRLTELYISSRNEKWLLSNGAIEYGRGHYPFVIALHTGFIISMVAEYYSSGQSHQINYVFLAFLIVLLLFKWWILASLGRYWNTRVYRIPGSEPVKRGPYRFIKHPNYVDVVGEIAIIPLVFHLYYTAIIFSILNVFMLTVRIRVENKVWGYK